MKGTNYIDHRFPCKDMIRDIVVGRGWVAVLDMNGNLLYLANCTISRYEGFCQVWQGSR